MYSVQLHDLLRADTEGAIHRDVVSPFEEGEGLGRGEDQYLQQWRATLIVSASEMFTGKYNLAL